MGGTLAFVKAWIRSSTEEGSSSVVLALEERFDEIRDGEIEIVTLASRPGIFRYSRALVPWLEQNIHNYDAVIIHGIWQYHSFGSWRVLRGHSVPYFVFPHGMLDDWFRRTYPLKHLKKSVYWFLMESKVLRDARGVIFTSEDERESSKNAFYPYRVRDLVCSLGIPDVSKNAEEQIREFKMRFVGGQGKRIILFLGRLHPKKGCDLLIRAFAEVFRDQSEIVLVMAGPEGEKGYERQLRNLAKVVFPDGVERIIWTGMIEGNLKWGALRSAELFVLPSHQENFGMAVAESLACGTPVLISNQVNIWREIRDGDAGFVERDTFEGTTLGLKRWNSLREMERNDYRAKARRLYESDFQINASIARINQIVIKSIS